MSDESVSPSILTSSLSLILMPHFFAAALARSFAMSHCCGSAARFCTA